MNNYMRFTLCCTAVIAALGLAACSENKVDEEKTAELIQPVARVELAGAAPATAASGASTAEPKTGEQVVQQICTACHGTGAAGSPKTGDKAAWAPRVALGKDALYKSALLGKNAMPAKGGNPALSDAEIKAAVDYLLAQVK